MKNNENRFDRFKEDKNVADGATVSEVTDAKATKKRKRKSDAISVGGIDRDIFDYVESTGIPMTNFVRMALREKMDRDKK